MEHGSADERQLIRHAIEHGEVDRMSDIVAIVRRTGALAITRSAALQEAEKARSCLAGLPDSPYLEALLDLCVRSVDRSS